jgi:protein SCO1/2
VRRSDDVRPSTAVRATVLALAGLGLVLAALVVHARSPRDEPPAPVTAGPGPVAPHWDLRDQNGREVSSEDLDGKVRVVSFLFPFCTTYCPVTARSLAQLEDELRGTPLADRVEVVVFNVDPTGADRGDMRSFWRHFGGDPHDPHVAFLTGPPATIRHVVTDGYKVAYSRVTTADQEADATAADASGTSVDQPEVPNPVASRAGVDYDVVHNDVIEIVGPDGRIDRVLDQASDVPEPTLLRAVKEVAAGG